MAGVDEQDAVTQLRQWVFERGLRGHDEALQPGSHLLEEGWLDSLGLISLIVFLERLRGRPFADGELAAGSLVSIERIRQTFFTEGVAA